MIMNQWMMMRKNQIKMQVIINLGWFYNKRRTKKLELNGHGLEALIRDEVYKQSWH